MFTCEALVDEQVLFIVAHGVAEVHDLHSPALTLELVNYDPTEILLVDGIVRAEGGSIEIIDHRLVSVLRIIAAEVLDECRNLTLELDVEGFDYIEAAVSRLTGDNPVDIGVVVHANADGRVGINVLVGAGVEKS